MWGGWTGRPLVRIAIQSPRPPSAPAELAGGAVREAVYRAMGVDAVTGIVDPHGALAATPMAVLRRMTVTASSMRGPPRTHAETARGRTPGTPRIRWHSPDRSRISWPCSGPSTGWAPTLSPWPRRTIASRRSGRWRRSACRIRSTRLSAPTTASRSSRRPAMILAICRRLGVEPARTAMVGDSAIDLRMGRAAGVARCIGVLSGTGTRAELSPLADVIVSSVAELVPGA